MKYIKYYMTLIRTGFVFLFIIFFSACYQYPELSEIQYEDYIRVVGPEGGTINFYANYENDSIEDILVSMEFPENALDSLVVFNMYEFFDEAVFGDLKYMNRLQQSDFLYFVPFFESDGYIKHPDDTEILSNQHLSIDFASPVRVSYNLNFYDVDINAQLYRIKIPRVTELLDEIGNPYNEWGQLNNVWVNYNSQGYPDGYGNLDLAYLINGQWTSIFDRGTGNLSLSNWELVSVYEFNIITKMISFEIDNTDYMYVMAKDIIN